MACMCFRSSQADVELCQGLCCLVDGQVCRQRRQQQSIPAPEWISFTTVTLLLLETLCLWIFWLELSKALDPAACSTQALNISAAREVGRRKISSRSTTDCHAKGGKIEDVVVYVGRQR